jgi:hypothetical protein
VSIVVVTAQDEFEAARPQKGVVIRVRTAWENAAQGFPKRPIAELVRLSVDGAEVKPTVVEKKRPDGKFLADHYHQFHIAEPAQGKHTATARVCVLETKMESDRTIEFKI